MKKYLIIAVLLIVLLVGGYIYLLKNSATKPAEENLTNTLTSQVEESTNTTDYKNAFIEANAIFTCQIIAQEIDVQNELEAKVALNKIYQEYEFPVDDDTELIKILDQYQNDEEIIALIKEKVQACK